MPPKKSARAALDALDKDHKDRENSWKAKAKAKAAEIAVKTKGKLPASWDVSDHLSGFAKCLRYFLVLCNVALLIFALWLLIRASYNKTAHIYALLETWFTPAIVLGSFFLILSLVGALGSWFMNRLVLWVYAILLLLFGFVMMVASSYMLAMLNNGRGFLTNAWTSAPASIRENLEQTFQCCGLNTFMDQYAFVPCPDGSFENLTMPDPMRNATMATNNLTGYGCIDGMLTQFDAFSTSIPTAGLVMWVLITIVGFLAIKLALLISRALKEGSVEIV